MVELDAPEAYEAVTLKAGTTLTALGSLCQNHDPPSHARGHVNAPLGTSQLSSPAIPRPCGRRRLPAPRAIVETAGSTTAGRSPEVLPPLGWTFWHNPLPISPNDMML